MLTPPPPLYYHHHHHRFDLFLRALSPRIDTRYFCVRAILKFYSTAPAKYSGEWVKGKRTGVGAMHFADGTRFEGEYGDGVEQGYGLAWAPDGRRNDGF